MGHSVAGTALAAVVAPAGLSEASGAELSQVRDLAARLISPDVAGEAVLRAIHDRTGEGVYVVRRDGRAEGFLAFIFVNAAGLAAIADDAFDPRAPQLEYVTARGEAPAALYCWGIAASGPRVAAALVRGSWAARAALPDLPYFVRAATDAGRRLLTGNMNFVPYPGSATGLLWWPLYDADRRAA